jgi:hypothetical protein
MKAFVPLRKKAGIFTFVFFYTATSSLATHVANNQRKYKVGENTGFKKKTKDL